jgi:predicted GIY-YIG superfamily endonuclease
MDTPRFFYVYILESLADSTRHYTGFTEDLKQRVDHHNAGGVPHTAKFRPWKLQTAIAFTDRQKALDFERYLKSGSGRAFAVRRL